MNKSFLNFKTITKIFPKNKVVLAFLFGSGARKKLTKLSDLDFGVVLDKSVLPIKYHQVRLSLLDQLSQLIKDRPLDVAILNEASPLLAQMVITRGKIIYCQDDNLRSKFQIKTLKSYDDAVYLRKAYYYYLENRVKNNHLGETYV